MPFTAPPRRTALAVLAALSLALLAAPPVATLAAGPACHVKNTTHPATFGRLQNAVGAATAGDRLEVRGSCAGQIAIGKNLTIVGVKTQATGIPTLTGNDETRVLWIKATATVTLSTLVIRNGRTLGTAAYPQNSGAGILLDGKVTLKDVIVRNNHAPGDFAGSGGIEVHVNSAVLIVAGASEIKRNSGGYGGGIEVYGTATLKDTARVHHNASHESGGGIYNGGTLTLKGHAQVDHNTADGGHGGGIEQQGIIVGAVCGGNVHDNTPDDIAPACT